MRLLLVVRVVVLVCIVRVMVVVVDGGGCLRIAVLVRIVVTWRSACKIKKSQTDTIIEQDARTHEHPHAP